MVCPTPNPHSPPPLTMCPRFCLLLPCFSPLQNDIPAARQDFLRATQLRNNKRRNIVGHLALAAVMYNQKQYKEALQT